jgi:hypothetical protein
LPHASCTPLPAQALLRFICTRAEQLGGGSRAVSRTFLSFYAATLCELLHATAKVRRPLLAAHAWHKLPRCSCLRALADPIIIVGYVSEPGLLSVWLL